MAKNKITLEELCDEARENARMDREKALEFLHKLKDVFDIDTKDSSSMSAAMLVGGNVVKLAEQLTRSNEQLVRLAQIKEREESKTKKDVSDKISLADIEKVAKTMELDDDDPQDSRH